ncbi:division plane positioning ATPase MipZ [Rhodovibrionaceae bacterium A322]
MTEFAQNPSVKITGSGPEGRRSKRASAQPRPRVVVLGNEKGGSGKSTTAMHLIVGLLRQGKTVAAIDLDARQGTLARYIENRARFVEESGKALPMPLLKPVLKSELPGEEGEKDDRKRLMQAVQELVDHDYLVIDTPGSDNHLSRLGHTLGDVLISPMNDSFIDLDLLARFDADGKTVVGPSVYSQLVWEQRQQRARMGGQPVDWIVMRNRLSHLDARNKQKIGQLLEILTKRMGFRLAPGFSERVVFRELFPSGLTLLDLRDIGQKMTMSHVAARQEVRDLLRIIGLEPVEEE